MSFNKRGAFLDAPLNVIYWCRLQECRESIQNIESTGRICKVPATILSPFACYVFVVAWELCKTGATHDCSTVAIEM